MDYLIQQYPCDYALTQHLVDIWYHLFTNNK